MTPEWQRWLEFAERDLRSSEELIDGELYANACFHAQQAVEKALKGLLLCRDETIPKIHSLPELFVLAGEAALAPYRDAIDVLNKYYIPTRYPDLIEGEEPSWFSDDKEARAALAKAREVTETVIAIINKS
jgi:HEPN domain-containing protein